MPEIPTNPAKLRRLVAEAVSDSSTEAQVTEALSVVGNTNRHARLGLRLRLWQLRGVIAPGYRCQPGDRHGRRYLFTVRGGSERCLTGAELDVFLDGVEAARDARAVRP